MVIILLYANVKVFVEKNKKQMTNNKQQTAVDWLIDEHFGGIENCTPDFRYKIQQAKEMDKEKLTDAYCDGKANGMDISHPLSLTKEISADEWYNETYGGPEQ